MEGEFPVLVEPPAGGPPILEAEYPEEGAFPAGGPVTLEVEFPEEGAFPAGGALPWAVVAPYYVEGGPEAWAFWLREGEGASLVAASCQGEAACLEGTRG